MKAAISEQLLKVAGLIAGMMVSIATILFGVWTMINASEVRTAERIGAVEVRIGAMEVRIGVIDVQQRQVADELKDELHQLSLRVARLEGAMGVATDLGKGD